MKYISLNVAQTLTSVHVNWYKDVDGLKDINLSSERMKQKDALLLSV